MPGTFNYDNGPQGLFIVVDRQPISPSCLSAEEIDASILRLQTELDRVGARMKRALSVRNPSIFDAQDT